jgi:hypothetical protein
MAKKDMIKVAKDDVLAAWAILENLAVSFDQIGSAFGRVKDNGAVPRPVQEALAAYLTPTLVQEINEARVRLGQYIPDEEAEALSERITYWDYASLPKEV